MFVTMFVARLDLKTGHMEYCNAGHAPILVMPPDADPYLLKSKPNLVLGMCENFTYEAEQVDFKPGTRIVAYTDGVTEAERKDLSQYGNERLLAWAQNVVETRHGTSLQDCLISVSRTSS
jgi:sigma-B regulation protein RsbU (phosphoserine phosphatase)